MVAGIFDYLVKIRVSDVEAYRDFLGHALSNMPGVAQTRTYIVMQELKSTTKVPI